MKRCVVIVLGTVLLTAAACGGDDGSSAGPAEGTGRDQAYVTGLCKAVNTFSGDMDKAMSGPTPTDFGQALDMVFKGMAAPLQRFSQSFSRLKPPADLKDWHEDTSRNLSAAASALKSGELDDPALDSLGDSPLPDMPSAPRERLAAIADKTSECKQINPFVEESGGGASSGSGSKAPSPALKNAASGTWTGKFGTLVFDPDGNAVFELKSCGTDSSSREPFQVTTNCSAQRFSGKVDVEAHNYVLRDKQGAGSVFGAYVDKDGRLHVGIGDVSAFGPGQKGSIDLFAQPRLEVDGDKCTQSGKRVPCSWKKEEGQDILEFETGSGASKVIILPAEGLAAEPATFVSVFDRKK